MALYGVTGIRVNPNNNRITHARLGQIDGQTNHWVGPLQVVEAHEVADRLVAGDTVYSIHTIEGGHTVPGAKARHVVFDNGAEGFDTLEAENHPGRTVRDLPQV
jgi:hypothetical protein